MTKQRGEWKAIAVLCMKFSNRLTFIMYIVLGPH